MPADTPPAAHAAAPAPLWQRLLPVALILVALAAAFGLGLDRYLTLAALKENRAALAAFVETNLAAALAIYIAAYAVAVAISLPGAAILTILGGLLFGLWGTIPTVIAATLGATAVFIAARTAFGATLRSRASGWLARFEKGFAEDAFSYLLVLRLVPLFPFWLVNVVPALLGMRTVPYALATLIGIVPGTFVYTSIGHAAGAVFDRGEDLALSGVMTDPAVLIPIVGLALLALVPVAYKRLRKG